MPTDRDANPGDVFETLDGSRFVVLPNGRLAYLGNKILVHSEGLRERTGAECKILGTLPLYPYKDENDFQEDWDAVQGIERMPISLPKGCTCGRTAIMSVLTCPIHDVRFSFRP